MNGPAWLGDMQALAARCPRLDIGTDHAANVARAREDGRHALAGAWAMYRCLARMAGGGDD